MTEVRITSDFGVEKINFLKVPESEVDFWKIVGEKVSKLELDEPTKIEITGFGKSATLKADFFDAEKPVFKLLEDNFNLPKSVYGKKCLRNVDPATDKKLFYDLVPVNMGPITVAFDGKYGLLGTNAAEEGHVIGNMPTQLFWLKYYQKLNEGYSDDTDLIGDFDEENAVTSLFGKAGIPTSDEDDTAVELYQELASTAKMFLNNSFNINWLSQKSPYTKAQVKKLWELYAKLCESAGEKKKEKAVKKANDAIIKLLKIASPTLKRGMHLSSFLVNEDDDIASQINSVATDWENRIQAIEAVVVAKPSTTEERTSPFGNVTVRQATEEEFNHMKELIAAHCPAQVQMLEAVYMIDHKNRTERYEEAIRNSENKTEKELFHGSITSNMVSLIAAGGPTIHVHAANGRAYGNGSYWSSDFDKSLGYTSYHGSRWANGLDDRAWMLVGRVHYGNPYFPVSGVYDAEKEVKEGGYDCCHALPATSGFRKDEIITYDEDHSCVEAILKLKAI